MRMKWFLRTFVFAAAVVAAHPPVLADESTRPQLPRPGEAWKSSPYHGVPNAATGQNIPCICRYQGRDYRVGERVCMRTHVGTVITVCDLHLNNTTWSPTEDPCEVS